MIPIVINIDHLFMIRIGIAVGALVCGVIGATKPVFDIWGDTNSKYKHHLKFVLRCDLLYLLYLSLFLCSILPYLDIWDHFFWPYLTQNDCVFWLQVNEASRMDSTGLLGCIQVTPFWLNQVHNRIQITPPALIAPYAEGLSVANVQSQFNFCGERELVQVRTRIDFTLGKLFTLFIFLGHICLIIFVHQCFKCCATFIKESQNLNIDFPLGKIYSLSSTSWKIFAQ